jgi:hypothetical protein
MGRPRQGVRKRQENAILSRIDATVKKYGFDAFRLVANRYILDNRSKAKLEREIQDREKELEKLKNQRR